MALGASVLIAGPNGARSEAVESFIQGQYQTSLAPGEIIVGFDVPRPAVPLRWGFFKVAPKSGAFAKSIAFAVPRDQSISVVLAAAAPRPYVLPRVAEKLSDRRVSDDALRAAITADIASVVTEDDAYVMRLHASTVLRAVKEMQSK
jgi:aerobic carbon-monoxide dehydrogenase medium subunit